MTVRQRRFAVSLILLHSVLAQAEPDPRLFNSQNALPVVREVLQGKNFDLGEIMARDNCAFDQFVSTASARDLKSGVQYSVSAIPGAQEKVDEAYFRIFLRPEGISLVKKLFHCDILLLKHHLGMSPKAAGELAERACGKAGSKGGDELIASLERSKVERLSSSDGTRVLRELFSCDAAQISHGLGLSQGAAQALAGACLNAGSDSRCQPRSGDLFDVYSRLAPSFDRIALNFAGFPKGRCLAVAPTRLASSPYDSYSLQGLYKTIIYSDVFQEGRIEADRLEKVLLHEFAIIADAKSSMEYPAFFLANGLAPSDIKPSARAVSMVLGYPLIERTLSWKRAQRYEDLFLSSTKKFRSLNELVRLSQKELTDLNQKCVLDTEAAFKELMSQTNPWLWIASDQVVFDGTGSERRNPWKDSDLDPGLRLEKRNREILGTLRNGSVTVSGKTIPLCVWLEVPNISGIQYQNGGGPRPRVDGD